MYAAVNVGAIHFVKLPDGLDHRHGFCAVAALSRYTSGLPCIVCFSTGNSSRILSTSKPAEPPY